MAPFQPAVPGLKWECRVLRRAEESARFHFPKGADGSRSTGAFERALFVALKRLLLAVPGREEPAARQGYT